jgi:hypothetical protein
MTKFRSRRPSAALIVSIIALVAALGGTAYAGFKVPKNSVGSKQLKNNAVTTKKIKNGAVTASKINTAGLTVPNALHANSANTATTATTAAAASGLNGVSIVRVAGISNPAGLQAGGAANCPAGTNVIGGGAFSSSGSTAVNINSSYPTRQHASDPEPNAWHVDMNNASGSSATFNVYAVCAPVSMTSNYTGFTSPRK